MECYKNGGCGVYEMYSCSECPASKPIYKCRNCHQFSVCHDVWEKGCFSVACDFWNDFKKYHNILKEEEEKRLKKIKEEKIQKEQELIIKSLFRHKVCPYIPCGSQRCDASNEWLDGCRTFKEFKCSIEEVIEKYKNYK